MQGRYTEAELLIVRALSILEQQLGINHYEVAGGLDILAGLYTMQGQYAKAEPLCMRSLSIFEQQLGNDHPDVAVSLNNLARLYRSQERYVEAESLYLQALPILLDKLGENHEWTQQATKNWRSFLQKVIQEQRTHELSDDAMTQTALQELHTEIESFPCQSIREDHSPN